MTDVNEIFERVLECLPCLLVNRTHKICKRYKRIIHANGDYWIPQEVTVKMPQSFSEVSTHVAFGTMFMGMYAFNVYESIKLQITKS